MKKLKEEFIKYLGEEKWEEEEILEMLQDVAFNVCTNWLGRDIIPILFKEDSCQGKIRVYDVEVGV